MMDSGGPPPPPQRTYQIAFPSGSMTPPTAPGPLVIAFHDYGDTVDNFLQSWGLRQMAMQYGFTVLAPQGLTEIKPTTGPMPQTYWNATDACCDFNGAQAPVCGALGNDACDISFVVDLLNSVSSQVPFDTKRIYVMGVGNGGFMAERIACDLESQGGAPVFAGLIDINGANFTNQMYCQQSNPVSTLVIHSSDDEFVGFGGSMGSPMAELSQIDAMRVSYPSAQQTVNDWIAKGACSMMPTMLPPIDLVTDQLGPETTVADYTGCGSMTDVQLWTVVNAKHQLMVQKTYFDPIWAFMSAHPL
jgi:polyhydroxybutyrate depolymerase